MSELPHPEALSDGVIELRRWADADVAAVRAVKGVSADEALVWVRRQQTRPSSIGVSCAVAPIGQSAVGYAGLIRRPRVELGARSADDARELVFTAHRQVVGVGFWIAPEAQGAGLATRALVLLSRWALRSTGVIRVEALIDVRNVASRRVAEKSGFRSEGHLRSYLELDGQPADALVYSLLESDL